MAVSGARPGRITTFYSFKGGVGRTMALANVAFLAAMNGLKVLIMDWDLEAPGLNYYFRGLPDQEAARAINTAPGVLDLVWHWRRALLNAKDADDFDAILQTYAEGRPFADCTRNILDAERCPGLLHIIGAGSKVIDDEGGPTYADALARFSWTEFFDQYGGGLFIERLRAWAKSQYDIILIDSRTGFADVAGVCTVQLPDTVALSFIYNRQNIEGVAAVAASVQASRNGAVTMRAVPMRVSRLGPFDEAEARSRASRALQRSGGFTAEQAKADIEHLGIRASPSVPFYETLAPFAPTATGADELSNDYRNLAQAICGDRKLDLVEIPPSWRESVRQRLEPRMVTVDYIDDLREADPARAAEEIARLLEGAVESELYDGGNDREYLEALVDFALNFEGMVFDEIDAAEVERLARSGLDLLRVRSDTNPADWNEAYVVALERFDEIFEFGREDADQLARFDLYDRLLSEATPSASVMTRRAELRRRGAQILSGDSVQNALVRLDEADELLRLALGLGSVTAEAQRIRLTYERAMMLERVNRPADAQKAALEAVSLFTPDIRREDLGRVWPSLQLMLMRLETDPERAAGHLEMAMKHDDFLNASPGSLTKMVEVLDRSQRGVDLAPEFIRRLSPGRGAGQAHTPALFFGRSLNYARDFVTASVMLASIVGLKPGERSRGAIEDLLRVNASVVGLLARRSTHGALRSAGPKTGVALLAEATTLLEIGITQGAAPATVAPFAEALASLKTRLRPSGKDAQ